MKKENLGPVMDFTQINLITTISRKKKEGGDGPYMSKRKLEREGRRKSSDGRNVSFISFIQVKPENSLFKVRYAMSWG